MMRYTPCGAALPVSRRSMLAGAAALVAAPAIVRAQEAQDFDVAVIGAGAAGLAAGRELQRRGKRFVILESRDRIGGRLFTDASLGAPFDAGAIYIHWAERNPWREIAAQLGVAAIDEPNGGFRAYERGRVAPEEERRRRRSAFGQLSRLLDGPGAPDVSVAERVATGGPDLLAAAGGAMRMSIGEEPERVSALDYARLWSGDDLVMPTGYGALALRFGEGLPVRLGAPALAVRRSAGGVRIETPAGTVSARRAIITVPVGVLKAGRIAFDPVLPDATLAALGGLEMGVLSKIALKFSGERFGVTPHSNLFATLGPRETFNFDCWSFDRDLVVAHLGGDHARAVIGLGEAGAVEAALSVFAEMVGGEARKAFVAGRAAGWIDDPHALGAYSHAMPGHAGARAALAEPVDGQLWFAGEATGGANGDFGGAMTAGGAFLSGQAAARAAAGV